MDKISVIIPSYRPGEKLRACVDSILASKGTLDFDIWVIDSSEESPEPLLGNLLGDERLHLVKSSRRLFPGEARDMGVKICDGEILVFTDSDCLATPYWLNDLVGGLLECGCDVCGGSIENGTPESYFGTAEYLSEFSSFTPRNRDRKERFVPSCNMAILRSSYLRTGGFPHDREKGSDVAFGKAITDAGMRIMFLHKPTVVHVNRSSCAGFFLNQYRLGRGFAANFASGNQPLSFLSARLTTSSLFLASVFPARLARIIYRSLINHEIDPLRLFLYLPALALGALGFTAGCIGFFVRKPQRDSKRMRDETSADAIA